jgi:hypothetical protein
MMAWRADVALILLALGLYLYDSLLLLASDEAVLFQGWRGRWHAGFGADSWRLGRREPLLPNPLTPHRPLFRLRWRFDAPNDGVTDAGARLTPAPLSRLTPFVLGVWFALFVLLPAGLFSPAIGVSIAVAVGFAYLNIVAALVTLAILRARLGLAPSRFAALAIECLLCPPFAVNLVRKLAALTPSRENFLAASERLLSVDALAQAHAACVRRLDEQIDLEAESSPRMASLLATRRRFVDATPR